MKATACGCCDPGAPPTPLVIDNRPGLAEVAYRIGTYAEFRDAMLDQLARQPALARWTARTDDDYGMAVLDLWAYVADILTFYQERTANEAFLRTARLPGSVRRLAALVGYVPAPGLAAEARLVFDIAAGRRLALRPGMRVQSVPGDEPDAKPQKFETDHGLDARGELSSLPLRPVAVAGGFKPDGAALTPSVDLDPPVVGSELVFYDENRGVVERKRVTEVRERAGITEVRWDPPRRQPPPGGPLRPLPELNTIRPVLRTLRPFGHDAPPTWFARYTTAAGELRVLEVPIGQTRSGPGGTPAIGYPKGLRPTMTLALDAVYPDLSAGTELLFASEFARLTLIRTVTKVTTGAAERGPLSATVTWVDLHYATPDVDDLGGLTILEVGDPLPVWNQDRPDTVSGSSALVEVDGAQPLDEGREVMLADDEGHAQAVTIRSSTPVTIRQGATWPDHLRIDFAPALSPALSARSARFFGNVVRASHGESVRDELLGTGDAAEAFQTLPLAKRPVTHRPAPGGGRSAGSTLRVWVAGLEWHERDTLFGAGGDERTFVTRTDDDGKVRVRLGDGDSAARAATGAAIVANYRRGLGKAGNVPAGSLTVALDKPAGLAAVRNPLPAAGGVDPERAAETRSNAPGSVRTFGRIVSLRDFEDQARAGGLVAKARARWAWAGSEPLVVLTVAGPDGAHVRDLVYEDLAADLDARRDPNRRLRIEEYVEVGVEVRAAIVAHDPDRRPDDVQAAATAALDALFAFDRRDLGEPVHLSDVFAALQSATGVVGVDVERFRYKLDSVRVAHGVADVDVAPHLPIRPGELAALAVADREVVMQ